MRAPSSVSGAAPFPPRFSFSAFSAVSGAKSNKWKQEELFKESTKPGAKNGSYGKLLKAYYSEVDDADTKKAIKEEAANKKAELVQDALSKKSEKSSTDTTYNAMADKIKNLSDSVSTLFNESI